MVDCAAVFTVQATLHEVELLSRRDYPIRVFVSWEQASEKEPLLACMEFQVILMMMAIHLPFFILVF